MVFLQGQEKVHQVDKRQKFRFYIIIVRVLLQYLSCVYLSS